MQKARFDVFLLDRTRPARRGQPRMPRRNRAGEARAFTLRLKPGDALHFIDGGRAEWCASAGDAAHHWTTPATHAGTAMAAGHTATAAANSTRMATAASDPDPTMAANLTGTTMAANSADTAMAMSGGASVAQLRQELLAVVSHELRSPLSGIQSWTHVLRQSLDDGTSSHAGPAVSVQVKRALDGISAGVARQTEMVETLIDAARVLAGDIEWHDSTFRLDVAVSKALDQVRGAIVARHLTVERSVAEPPAARDALAKACADTGPAAAWQTLTADFDRTVQVITLLLSNAVKFNHDSGTIRVHMAAADADDGRPRSVTLRIEDSGIGIPAGSLPRIFDTFSQADQSSTRRWEGLGLGLSVARQLIAMLGGRLDARSAGEAQGAQFILTLPLPQRSPVGDTRSDAPVHVGSAPSLHGLSILVIDDQLEARESLVAVLEQSGAEVLSAASGQEALAHLEARGPEREPDVVICDIAMPDEDGYVTLQRIREWEAQRGVLPGSRVAAIAVTAFAQREDRERALSRGYALHFAKPVDPPRLLGAVAALSCK